MALGQNVAVMGVEGIDQRCARIGGARDTRAPPIHHHARPAFGAAEEPHGLAADDPRQIGLRPACRDADEVEQAALRLRHDIRRQIREGQVMDEGHGGQTVIHREALHCADKTRSMGCVARRLRLCHLHSEGGLHAR